MLLQLKDLITEALGHLSWYQQEKVPSTIADLHHHGPLVALKALAIVWTFAAFGEEFEYRALFLRRTANAFRGRGKMDFQASHDLEDFVAVIEGRDTLLQEIAEFPQELRRYLAEAARTMLAEPRFLDVLPGSY